MTYRELSEKWLNRKGLNGDEEFYDEAILLRNFAKYLDRREKGLKDKTIRGDYVKMSGTQFALKIQKALKEEYNRGYWTGVNEHREAEALIGKLQRGEKVATLSKEGRNRSF